MAISINWATKLITIPADFLTHVSGPLGAGGLYELDVNEFRLALKDIEDSEGMPYLDTHRHNTAVTIGGVTYARTFEIINGYTIKFDESVIDMYTVRCANANHNIADVKVVDTVSLIVANAAGLITVSSGSGLSVEQSDMLMEIYQRLGLAAGKPLVQTQTQISTPDFALTVSESPGTVTVERQP